MSGVQSEFARLAYIFDRIGKNLNRQAPATPAQIDSIAATTGVEVDDDLKALWLLSNGSGNATWFADGDDEFTPYYFLSVEEALEGWQFFAPYDEATYHEWYDDESWGERDPRIQRHFLRHRHWLSFAEFNGGSCQLLFDSDPTAEGTRGQIINYVHDPDGVFWTADRFLEFFRTSNDTLETCLEDPEELYDMLS